MPPSYPINGRDMTKTAEIQRAQASNDADVASIKRNAKASMAAIEMLQGEIDYSDIASSAERMRHTIVAGLSTRLKKELDALHGFEDKVNTEYREVVERRLRVVTGKDVEEEQVGLDTHACRLVAHVSALEAVMDIRNRWRQ